jgi:hypothetical protein
LTWFSKGKNVSVIQHEIAHGMLSVIRRANADHQQLNYQSAAQALGRSSNSARAVANACDLLDAAAAQAGVPSLALVSVLNAAWKINPMAWKKDTPPWVREKVIERARFHKFTDADYDAIKRSLTILSRYGNRAAWREVKKLYSDAEFYYRLTMQSDQLYQNNDAIDDLGSDHPNRVPESTMRYERDPAVRKAVKARAGGKCEYCGSYGFQQQDGTNYLEAHHVIALANDGVDRLTNVIALCPGHHREAHYGANKLALEDEMIKILQRVCGT